MIYETVVTTISTSGVPHIAPMGVRYETDTVLLMPFKPSTTYDNVLATACAVVNFTTDTRIFAGCVTGRRSWPTLSAEVVPGVRLEDALGHVELRLREIVEDTVRPTLRMQRMHERIHKGFAGFNRAQAAVVEGAILVSRLDRLPRSKIEGEMQYLKIAIDKTAGPIEREAWQWLCEAVEKHLESQ